MSESLKLELEGHAVTLQERSKPTRPRSVFFTPIKNTVRRAAKKQVEKAEEKVKEASETATKKAIETAASFAQRVHDFKKGPDSILELLCENIPEAGSRPVSKNNTHRVLLMVWTLRLRRFSHRHQPVKRITLFKMFLSTV